MRIHIGEKKSHMNVLLVPHECSVCCKKFSRRALLACHMRILCGTEPYLCSFAGRKFNISQIYQHMLGNRMVKSHMPVLFVVKRFIGLGYSILIGGTVPGLGVWYLNGGMVSGWGAQYPNWRSWYLGTIVPGYLGVADRQTIYFIYIMTILQYLNLI